MKFFKSRLASGQRLSRVHQRLGALCVFLCLLVTLGLSQSSKAASVVISEFLAENDGGYRDQDGDSSDWIELHNISAATVDLGGWHLTDNSTNLTKWTFPPTNLPAGGYLVVFASGKNRATSGAELHTNFQLDNGGGHLALLDPNGVVASEFNYAPQHRNVSYGLGPTNAPTATLLASGDTGRWLVPTDSSLGTSWTSVAFNSASWSNTTTPLRYDVGSTGSNGAPVLSLDFDDDDSGEVGAANNEVGFTHFALNINNTIVNGVTISLSVIGSGALDDRDRSTPVDSPPNFTQDQIYDDFIFANGANLGDGMRIRLTGLTPNQDYRLTIWSYDSGSTGLRISDWIETGSGATNVIMTGYAFDGSSPPLKNGDKTFGANLRASSGGVLQIEGRRSGGGSPSVFVNALQLAPTILVPATNGNLSAMAGANSSLFERQIFKVTDPTSFSGLTLRLKYNDGFVAYLNGTEIARRNAPLTPDWNSASTASHSAATIEDIPLTGAPALLVSGTNVLAIQGLNLSAGDADFYLEPQLIGTLFPVTNGFFSTATPGTNNGTAFYGVVADTKFSVDRGFYDTPFSLSITSGTPGATIYFTTNGAEPSPANGLLISAPINIIGNSFIRAQAHLLGWIPSGIDTHSYIFLGDVLRQSNNIPNYPTIWQASYPADYGIDPNIVNHALYGPELSNDLRTIATLAIVADQNGLWNSSTGIYPNPTSIGPAWERAASLELIRGSDSHTQFATTARIQIHGNASRDNVRTPKHSIGVSFSSDYGPTKLHYDWFGGGVDTHNGIVLRSCGFVDGWAGRYADNTLYTSAETGETFRGLRYRPENTCYLRDVWMKDSFRAMGWSASRSSFVHLYLNGLYWGLYEPSEHLDASYFQLLYGGDEGAWDVAVGEDNNGPPVLVDGSLADWNNLLSLANAGVSNEGQYQAIAQLIDLDNLIDYMMLHIFGESEDWPRHNWFVAHRRATNGVPGTKFICSVWDQELTLDRLVRRNRIDVGNGSDGAGELYSPARIYAQLRNWPEFRVRFGDRAQKHFFNGGALTPSNNAVRFLASASVIINAVVGESARWGDARKTGVPAGQIGTGVTFTRDEWWRPEIDKMTTNFFQHLTADNVARLRAGNLYPAVGAPNFSQFGGGVPAGFNLSITHSNAGGTIFYTIDGSDPRVYGSGAVASSAVTYSVPVPINAPTFVRARVLYNSVWSALVETTFYPPQDLSRLALTEIMYNPPSVGVTSGDEFEFLELKNTGTNTLNLSGLTFTAGINFTFTNGTTLLPGAFFVLARNAAAFATKYPGVTVNGIYSGKLDNGGETITLSHPVGTRIFSITYDDETPWPITPDGWGFSLVQSLPGLTQAPDSGDRWRASSNVGGSPGADDPSPLVQPVFVNEVLTASVPPQTDTIELFNPNGLDVNIGGWFLTDDAALPKKYRITDNTIIPARAYMAFNEAQFNPTPGGGNSFSLNSHGDDVYLFSGDANTNLTGYSHGFTFGASDPGVTFGRYINSVGDEQFPAQISNTSPGPNSGPRVGPVVINEIMYHPGFGGDPFVELKNITATPAPLFDPAYPSNTWRLSGASFNFPTNISLPAQSYLLVVGISPTIFRAKYGIPGSIQILGPYPGHLQANGEALKLEHPAPPSTNGLFYVSVDEVRYNDHAPWPAAADGSGPSLQRRDSSAYGNDPGNWDAAGSSPGQFNSNQDSDGDGMPDSWEIANGTNPFLPDANADPDNDGFTNFQEYLAGTNPQVVDRFGIDSIGITTNPGNANEKWVTLSFAAHSNRTYSILFQDALGDRNWTSLTNVGAAAVDRIISATDKQPAPGTRFYKLAAPAVQ
jgi:hypothetical protein